MAIQEQQKKRTVFFTQRARLNEASRRHSLFPPEERNRAWLTVLFGTSAAFQHRFASPGTNACTSTPFARVLKATTSIPRSCNREFKSQDEMETALTRWHSQWGHVGLGSSATNCGVASVVIRIRGSSSTTP